MALAVSMALPPPKPTTTSMALFLKDSTARFMDCAVGLGKTSVNNCHDRPAASRDSLAAPASPCSSKTLSTTSKTVGLGEPQSSPRLAIFPLPKRMRVGCTYSNGSIGFLQYQWFFDYSDFFSEAYILLARSRTLSRWSINASIASLRLPSKMALMMVLCSLIVAPANSFKRPCRAGACNAGSYPAPGRCL